MENIPSESATRRTYVFLINDIGDVGGGQMTVARKVMHLKERGWRVEVFHFESGKPMLDPLKPYEGNHEECLTFRYNSLPQSSRDRYVKRLADKIEGDRIVVESFSINTAMWGEALARKLSERADAAHFFYLIVENMLPPAGVTREFMLFKREQGLLRGMRANHLHRLIPEIPEGECYLEALHHGTSFEDVDDDRLHKHRPDDEFRIVTVVRLEKPFVPDMLAAVKRFAHSIDDRKHKVRLIVIGDTRDAGLRRDLRLLMTEEHALETEWWGFTWPIPIDIIRMSDVFIGNAGSAMDASLAGTASLTIDTDDHKAIGIYGETTQHTTFRGPDEPPLQIEDMLRQLLRQRDLRREAKRNTRPAVMRVDYAPHDLIADTACEPEFFDMTRFRPVGIRDRAIYTACHLGLQKMIYRLKMRSLQRR